MSDYRENRFNDVSKLLNEIQKFSDDIDALNNVNNSEDEDDEDDEILDDPNDLDFQDPIENSKTEKKSKKIKYFYPETVSNARRFGISFQAVTVMS